MDYISHLSRDKRLKKIIDSRGKISLKKSNDIFLKLCGSIMSQQLSTRVAEVIYSRFLRLFNAAGPTPELVLTASTSQLREIGLSGSKVTYIHNVARFAIEKGLDHKKLSKKNSEEIVSYLTEIKGVGKWTAEMILMFTLAREDVFALDDLGIQQAMEKLYNLDKSDKKKFRDDMVSISAKWSPYRTYACMYLWNWKDNAKPDNKKSPRITKSTRSKDAKATR